MCENCRGLACDECVSQAMALSAQEVYELAELGVVLPVVDLD
ncbi:MAG: hypothetical protein ACPLRU_08960 [Desulfofundulus sp.]